MSTSDAGEVRLRAAPPAYTTLPSAPTGLQQVETFDERLKSENHEGGESAKSQRRSTSSDKEGYRVLIFGVDIIKQEETGHGEVSGDTFTSSLSVKLSKNHIFDEPHRRLKTKPDSRPLSFTEPQRAENENHDYQVNRRTSVLAGPDSDCQSIQSNPFLTTKEDDVISVGGKELETKRHLNENHSLTNGFYGSNDCNSLHLCPHWTQPNKTGSGSVDTKEDTKDQTELDKQRHSELSKPAVTMLSSTVVTVLAPHWSSRLRRNKRYEGAGNPESQGNLSDMGTQQQHGSARVLRDGTQPQASALYPGLRRNTVDWSTMSDPARLNHESRRKIPHTVSLDVNSRRMDNRTLVTGAVSPVASNAPPLSSLDQREQRRSSQQGPLSPLNSVPATSSLLRSSVFGQNTSSGRNSNAPSTFHKVPAPRDEEGNLLSTHLSQSLFNNNELQRSKPVLSPSSSVSFRANDNRPVLSPSPSNHRDSSMAGMHFFSTSPLNNNTTDTRFTKQPETCSNQAFLSTLPSARQQVHRDSNKNTSLFPKSTVPSPRHTPYDPSALLKTHPLPRRTTLTSTSWWKQVTQESSTETPNTKDLNTPLVPQCHESRVSAVPTPTDSQRFSSQIPTTSDNNNTNSVCKGKMNFIMTQGGTHNLKQINTEDSAEHTDMLFKRQYSSGSNSREPLKPLNLPEVLSRSKFSRATAQTTVNHPKDLGKDLSNNRFTPTFLNLKTSDTPTESRSKHENDDCSSETSSTPTFPYNKGSDTFTKPPLSLLSTVQSNTHVTLPKTTLGLPLTPNSKTTSSFQLHPVSSQTNDYTTNTPSYSQTAKSTNTTHVKLLGFERSYASIPKPIHSKMMSSLIPAVRDSSKTNIPVSSAYATSTTTGNNPTVSTSPSSSRLTPALKSSPTNTLSSILTPPSTPVITSPSYLDTSNPKEGKTTPSSPGSDLKKVDPQVKAKKVRRVTWEDSVVDQQCPEPITAEKPDSVRVSAHPPSPSRSPGCVRAPSIFSFLRSGSPTANTPPLCSPTPKTSSIQVERGGKYRSLSSDHADSNISQYEMSKQGTSNTSERQDVTISRPVRTQSMESGTVQCRSSVALSLPPDFSSNYTVRYSSPPYSTLMSSRSAQGEPKTKTPRSPLFHKDSIYTLSLNDDCGSVKPIPTFKPSGMPASSLQLSSVPLQNKVTANEGPHGLSEINQMNNYKKSTSKDLQNDQVLFVSNRVHSSPVEMPQHSCVTETLIYSIKSKANAATTAPQDTTPKPGEHMTNTFLSLETKLGQQPHRVHSEETSGETHSGQSSSSGSADSQSNCNKRTKESVFGKSRFFSMESNNEQSPKRSRFALKKSVSTPNSGLSRSDSDRSSKTNKMDQVLNKLKQTFSSRRSEDDPSFPWKWRKSPQTPSVGGSSDISSASDSVSAKSVQGREQEGSVSLKESDKGTVDTKGQSQNRYTIIPPPTVRISRGDQFFDWSAKSMPGSKQEYQNASAGLKPDSKTQGTLTPHSPLINQCDFYNNRMDHKPPFELPTCRDPSPCRSPNSTSSYPTQCRMSTSPRSPFSPFASLSPHSPFPSPEITDDNVFYSPKLQRRKESSSPCEPGEGISLGGSRRSRASTGPPSIGPGQDCVDFASSYADLKYGIEPGRSFSVSSVLSSRPSGPGRISTGSRFMSVGDLSKSSLTCGGSGKDLDQRSFTLDWSPDYDCQLARESNAGSNFPNDSGKMRSRSLPRSLTRRLGNWSSSASDSQPGATTGAKSAHHWSPNMNICHFEWDTEGPPTPPPTPPLSPVSRRMSQPPSVSSPTTPSPPGAPQSGDSQFSRGHLPSRGYRTSLSTFEESSDSGSDTTTDDEYYLEEEKETEL